MFANVENHPPCGSVLFRSYSLKTMKDALQHTETLIYKIYQCFTDIMIHIQKDQSLSMTPNGA